MTGCAAAGPTQAAGASPRVESWVSNADWSHLDRTRPEPAPGPGRERMIKQLDDARAELAADPDNPDKLIWVGRRLGYLLRIGEAINVFMEGQKRWPADARFYRHAGHRFISLGLFDFAILELERAAELIRGKPDEIEPDGQPNAENIPLTTLGFNVWYHLALARYLKRDWEGALTAWRETMKYSLAHDDNLCATTHWTYMTLRRLGRDDEAKALLEPIRAQMRILENHAYHRLLLMYKGEMTPEEVVRLSASSPTEAASAGYGVGNWYLCNGHATQAVEQFERVVRMEQAWPAFGCIAAREELRRLRVIAPNAGR
ncbi:hypothetical protein RAS1_35760 [Phycisphaerae bacterium RAS1]|nr:hypothetical protein RAS1_35760 [Phycisphaerae bacterium RAS1]